MRSGASVLLAAAACGAAEIPTVQLRNGVKMPLLALGVRYGAADNDTAAAVNLALKSGFTFMDTSHDYGNLKGVAQGIALSGRPRSSIFIDTKVPGCGVPTQGLPPPCYNNTLKMFQDDLSQLQTDYVDLLLVHFPPLEGCTLGCKHMQQQWAALEDIYAQGKAKAIGVSNFCQKCLECLAETQKVAPMANQMEYHVGMGADPAGLHSYCQERGIAVQGYSALAHGKALKDAAVTSVAQAHNRSTAQVSLRWMVQRQKGAITFADNTQFLDDDVSVFSFSLSDAEMAQIDAEASPKCSMDAPYSCCH